MRLFHKSWVLLIAMGLVICLAVQTGGVLAGELPSDTKISASAVGEISYNDDLTFTLDGAEGDPDGTLDALGGRTIEIQGLTSAEDSFCVEERVLVELMVRVLPLFWLF